MKAKNTFFKLVLIVTLFLVVTCNTVITRANSNIGIDYRPGINYVSHLYTLGNLGFDDKEYKDKYSVYLSEEDKNIFLQYKDLLEFGQGKIGKLTAFFFFIPAYADLKTHNEYRDYFTAIVSSMEEKSITKIKKYIPDEYLAFFNENFINEFLKVQKEFNEISGIYLRNVDTYMNEVYPIISKELKNQKDRLNYLIKNNDMISQWENETNYKWEKGDYNYLLFRAGKNGPSFNNLSANLNTCYYKIDEKFLVDMFSHEFGIFLMYDSIIPLVEKYKIKYPDYQNEYTIGRAYWMAFEMLSVFFNIRINERKTNDYYNFKHADPIAFMEIYTKLYEEGITDPKDLYDHGIKEYMKQDGYWNNGVKERYKILEN